MKCELFLTKLSGIDRVYILAKFFMVSSKLVDLAIYEVKMGLVIMGLSYLIFQQKFQLPHLALLAIWRRVIGKFKIGFRI